MTDDQFKDERFFDVGYQGLEFGVRWSTSYKLGLESAFKNKT